MDDEELDELFSEWKSEVLKELRPFLVDKLEPHKLFTYLRSCQVLDGDDQEDIEAERTRKRRNERLIDMVKNRGQEGFDNFCEAIRQNATQIFILTKILNSFQKKKDTYSGESQAAVLIGSTYHLLHALSSFRAPEHDQPTILSTGAPIGA